MPIRKADQREVLEVHVGIACQKTEDREFEKADQVQPGNIGI